MHWSDTIIKVFCMIWEIAIVYIVYGIMQKTEGQGYRYGVIAESGRMFVICVYGLLCLDIREAESGRSTASGRSMAVWYYG